MKFPGTDISIVLPAWPERFDLSEMLHLGVHVRVDKKTGDFLIRVDRPTPQKPSLYSPDESLPVEDDEGATRGDGA
jgi:hypothetical protein